jgi:pyrroline-5-carboxylate reductase
MTAPEADRFPASLLLVGAGKMGGALLGGWLGRDVPDGSISVLDPALPPDMAIICQTRGVATTRPAAPPAVAVLAVKPQSFEAVAADLGALVGPDTLLISIMAGKTIRDIALRLPARAIVRAMPNLPASIGRGITAAVRNDAVTQAQRDVADALLSAVGKVEWLDDEDLIDAVTAVSGSGPAYVFYLAECLAAAGIKAGLPSNLAFKLAQATIEGAAALMQESRSELGALRQAVTSPGGTTEAALEVLMAADGLRPLLAAAVDAAVRRAGALAG